MPEHASAATLELSWPCGQELVLLEDPFMTTEDSRVKRFHNSGHQFSHLSRKNEEVSPPNGTPQPNHDVGRVLASCTHIMHLKGRFSINLVVLVVIPLLDSENFLVHEEEFFVPILGGHWRRCCALVCQISFKAGVVRFPFQQKCTVICRLSLMRHSFIGLICSAFRKRSSVSRAISANPL